ncbi:MAG TPA: leucine-rich repeat domain-containing protein, partial [Candidatus Monoglobus merdigallinarum]|nr:leucine-rich repeat domain-containing protein [Candidatus Monoglobus merdigallinarum]
MKKLISVFLLTCMFLTITAYASVPDESKTAEDTEIYGVLSYRINADNTITIVGCNKEAAEVDIPAEIDGRSVTGIGDYAFRNCDNLKSVSIPSSVTGIGEGAFEYCYELSAAAIPYGVKSIEKRTFFGCESIASVTIPDSVTSIGQSAFYGCIGLKNVDIPNSVTCIEKYA